MDSILVKKTADGGDQNELPLTEIREDLDEESNVICMSDTFNSNGKD